MCYSPADNGYIVYYWGVSDGVEYSSPMCYSPVDNTYMAYYIMELSTRVPCIIVRRIMST